MKSILIILLAAGFWGSCGKNLPSGLEIGNKTTSVFIKGKKVSTPMPVSNPVNREKDYLEPGFSPMSLPGRF